MSGDIFEQLSAAVIEGDEEKAKMLAQKALESGVDPVDAIDKGLSAGIKIIGTRFAKQECFLPDVMLAADAMKSGIAILKPHITRQEILTGKGKVVIGTVLGDIHDIGKNLVATMLEVNSYDVTDLGSDVAPKTFITEAQQRNADIIAMSSLITASMYYMGDVIQNLKSINIKQNHLTLIGGGPTQPNFAKEIDADAWGRTAEDGVKATDTLIEAKKTKRKIQTPLIEGELT